MFLVASYRSHRRRRHVRWCNGVIMPQNSLSVEIRLANAGVAILQPVIFLVLLLMLARYAACQDPNATHGFANRGSFLYAPRRAAP